MSRSTDGTRRNRDGTDTGAGTEPRRGIAGRYRLGLYGDFARPEPIGSVPRNRPRNRNRAHLNKTKLKQNGTRDYASQGNKVELRAFYIGTIKATYGTNGVTAGAEIPIGLKDSKVPLGCAFSLDKHSYDRLKNLSSDIAKNDEIVEELVHQAICNVMTPKSMDVVFKRVSFAIQKVVAAQLVARLPSTSM
ncbi:hypothetical protein LXL04_025425 [Taraxacum kok-saghyz]